MKDGLDQIFDAFGEYLGAEYDKAVAQAIEEVESRAISDSEYRSRILIAKKAKDIGITSAQEFVQKVKKE